MGKLVRDCIPDIIKKKEGREPKTRVIPKDEIVSAAFKKLCEEVKEAKCAATGALPRQPGPAERKDLITEEFADIQEVLDYLCFLHGISIEAVRQMQQRKRHERGGFSRRISLEN